MPIKLEARKKKVIHAWLPRGTRISLVDVGSGGPLKYPWAMMSPEWIEKIEFDPTEGGGLMLCLSNEEGVKPFYVAHDERGSSLHPPLASFYERYGDKGIETKKTIEVQCTTMDKYFESQSNFVDCMDVNVEGHDFQALEGGEHLFEREKVKLLKVEFEIAPVWEGQGWFSDIDRLMRGRGYEISGFEMDRGVSASTAHLFYPGEPIWGKAYYTPTLEKLKGWSLSEEDLRKTAALYLAADFLGRCFDVLELLPNNDQMKADVEWAYRFATLEKLASMAGGVFDDFKRRVLG